LILLRLKGGLGYQLFQLGAAIRLAKNDIDLIRLDKSLLSNSQKTTLNELINKPDLIPKDIENEELELFKSSTKKIFSISDSDNGPFSDNLQLDWEIDFNKINILLDGYFQCEKNIYALKKYVGILNNITSNLFLNKNSENLVIHYQQGEYSDIDLQHKLDLIKLDYIDRAISTFSNDRIIEIHSKTIGILERYHHKKNIELKIGENEIKTFNKFMNAQKLVISNSAFSLSAALLSDNLLLLVRPSIWSKKYFFDDLTNNYKNSIHTMQNSFY
jgi:hypothetical protein